MRRILIALAFLTTISPRLPAQAPAKADNPLVTALAFAHRHAPPEMLAPAKDRELKAKLMDGKEMEELFGKEALRKFAPDGKLALPAILQSRQDMGPKVRLHADLLSTQFDMIEAKHHGACEQLVAWIVRNHSKDKPVAVIIICTGNTRRSMLGSTMGNIAAAYHGLPEIRFYSGGTEPSAFNPRTIATLKEIGVEIEPTGKEAERGAAGDPNPMYAVKWGRGPGTVEFSKKYGDLHNPKEGFAALLVCSEAETACPKVDGAGIRISLPYLDPKAYDGAAFEAGKYAERRDDIGRFMLSAMMQAKRRLDEAKATNGP